MKSYLTENTFGANFKKILFPLFLLTSVLILTTCENPFKFEQSEEYYVDITKPLPPQTMTINFTEQNDTLFAWGNANINYSLLVDNSVRSYNVIIYIDDNYAKSTSNDSVIQLNTDNYTDGFHKIKLRLSIPTNSNSLADILNAEFFEREIEKWIYFDNIPPSNPREIITSHSDSTLILNWNIYDRVNFQEYLVYRTSTDHDGNQNEELLVKIDNRNTIEYIDSSYLGGQVIYRVDLKALNITLTGIEENVNLPAPEILKTEILQNENAKITWRKCQLNQNFGYYEIFMLHDEYPGYILLKTTTNLNDTTLIDDNIAFGGKVCYSVNTHSKTIGDKQNLYTSISEKVFVGNEMIGIYYLKYHSANNCIYGKGDKNYKLNINDYSIEAETEGDVIVSTDGLKAYKLFERVTYEIDPNTFETIRSLDIPSLFVNANPQVLQSSIFCTHPNNYLFTGNFQGSSITTGSLIDVNQMIILDRNPPNNHRIWKASNNGKYLYTISNSMGYIFKVSNDSIIYNYPIFGSDYYNFMFDESGDRFILSNNQTISVRSCEDNSIIKEFIIDSSLRSISIDPFTGYLGGVRTNGTEAYGIYNLNDGSLIKEIKVLPQIVAFASVYLIDNTLFSGGLYKKI